MIPAIDIPRFIPAVKHKLATAAEIDAAILSGLGSLDIKDALKTSVSRVYERRAVLIENGLLSDEKLPQRKRRVRVGDRFRMITGDKQREVMVSKVGRKYFKVDALPDLLSKFDIATHLFAGVSCRDHVLVKIAE